MAWFDGLRWDSPQVHLWSVSNPLRSASSLLLTLLALVTVNGAVLGVVWLVGLALPLLAVSLAGAVVA